MGFKVNIPQIQAETNCTFFVATNGLDSNDGKSESQSLKTIQAAVNKAAPGDVVCVRTGTYGSLRVYPGQGMGRSGTAQQPIIYRVFGDGPVQLASIWIEGEYVEFRDFKVVGPGRDSNGSVGIFTASRESICCTHFQTNHVKFIGIEVTNFATGILGGGDDLEFREMDIHHNGYYWFEDMGIYLSGARIKIIGNRIHDNASTGIQLWNTSNDPTLVPNHTIVENNIIYANGFTVVKSKKGVGSEQYGRGIVLGSNGAASEGNLIQNNIIFANFPLGIGLYSLSNNTKIINNTIVANVNGIGSDERATNVIVKNNIVYDNNAEAVRAWLEINRPELLNSVNTNRHGSGFDLPATGIAASNNLTAVDPKFSNRANNDFHLIASSLAIDAGTSQDAPATDFEGTPRPQGNGYDIGADEYGGSATCDCTAWQNQSCGSESCSTNQMYQTRSCTPSNCSSQSHCINDTQCTPSPPVCNDNGICDSGEDTQHCPDDCPAPAPPADDRLTADFNCDNQVNIYDFGNLMSCWGSAYDPNHPHNCAGGALSALCGSPDLTGDGQVGVNDLGVLLSGWQAESDNIEQLN